MLKLALKYMAYYKSQTFAIFSSIILTAALLSGVGSLMYSSRINDLENNRMIYGDWHYSIPAAPDAWQSAKTGETEKGFSLELSGKKEVRDTITDPYDISFVYGDEAYLQMTGRELLSGAYPEKPTEIAADNFTLGNLGFEGSIGDTVTLDGNSYTLTGIVKSPWLADGDKMELFVSEDFGDQKSQPILYLKFREGKKLYRQLNAFLDCHKISGDHAEANEEVTKYLGGEEPESIFDIVKFALTDKHGNFTYIVLKLQAEYNLAFRGMVLLLCFFSLYCIYSIFQISVSKRTFAYGMMQTLGISDIAIGGTLMAELWILFLLGYPLGCLLGNGILKLFYQKLSGVFAVQNTGLNPAEKLSLSDRIIALENRKEIHFHVAFPVIYAGFLFLFFAMAVIGFLTLHSLKKQTIRKAMAGDTSFLKGRRKIYSKRNRNLAGIVVQKFMFSNRKRALGILLSLSLGGCIFLCTTYMVENLKIHAEMSMKSDDGLGTPYRISLQSGAMDAIPKEVVEQIKTMPEVSAAYASRYLLGEVTIQKKELEWEEYFDEQNRDSYFTERFGGVCVEKNNGTYGIKYDIYGYDPGLIHQLSDFLLEGEISREDPDTEHTVIAVANRDGQGNYNFYGKHPGDTLTLRVPKNPNAAGEILKFEDPAEDYVEKEFTISAIVSRPLAQEDRFFNVNGWSGHPSLILTNDQMERLYDLDDYSFINICPVSAADTDMVGSRLLQAIQDVPKAVLRDYTLAVKTRQNYLHQQQLFFFGIAAVLLVISLFHIMNSVNHSILSHRREYGILRAMGITDIGFYKMILAVGISYGLLTDAFIFLIYNMILRRLMDYYMAHVVQFLHFTASVPAGTFGMVMALNLLISLAAVIVPGHKILKVNVLQNL